MMNSKNANQSIIRHTRFRGYIDNTEFIIQKIPSCEGDFPGFMLFSTASNIQAE